MGDNLRPEKGFLRKVFSRHAPWYTKTARDIVLSVAFTAAAISYGPELIPGRPLTEDEISHFKEFYGDTIDYSKIKLHHSETSDKFRNMNGDLAMAMNDTLIISKRIYDGTYGVYEKYIMVHELGHVWQHQHSPVILPLKAVKQRLENYFSENKGALALYRYRLEPDKEFDDYGVEQQASILADYYALKEYNFWPVTLITDGQYPSRSKLEAQYRDVLTGIIPLAPEQKPVPAKSPAPVPSS